MAVSSREVRRPNGLYMGHAYSITALAVVSKTLDDSLRTNHFNCVLFNVLYNVFTLIYIAIFSIYNVLIADLASMLQELVVLF